MDRELFLEAQQACELQRAREREAGKYLPSEAGENCRPLHYGVDHAIPDAWRSDRELVLAVGRGRGPRDVWSFASDALRGDEDLGMRLLDEGGEEDVDWYVRFASSTLRASPAFVRAACLRSVAALEWADLALRGDVRFLLELSSKISSRQSSVSLLRFAVGPARDDAQLTLSEARRCGCAEALRFLSDGLRRDERLLLELLRSARRDLDWGAAEVVCREFALALQGKALAAVGADWRVFTHLDDAQRQGELLRAALRHTSLALNDANEAARADRGLVRLAARQCSQQQTGFAFSRVAEALRDDKALVLECLPHASEVFFAASSRLRGDREVAIAAVTLESLDLRWASEALRADRAVVLAAVRMGAPAARPGDECAAVRERGAAERPGGRGGGRGAGRERGQARADAAGAAG